MVQALATHLLGPVLAAGPVSSDERSRALGSGFFVLWDIEFANRTVKLDGHPGHAILCLFSGNKRRRPGVLLCRSSPTSALIFPSRISGRTCRRIARSWFRLRRASGRGIARPGRVKRRLNWSRQGAHRTTLLDWKSETALPPHCGSMRPSMRKKKAVDQPSRTMPRMLSNGPSSRHSGVTCESL